MRQRWGGMAMALLATAVLTGAAVAESPRSLDQQSAGQAKWIAAGTSQSDSADKPFRRLTWRPSRRAPQTEPIAPSERVERPKVRQVSNEQVQLAPAQASPLAAADLQWVQPRERDTLRVSQAPNATAQLQPPADDDLGLGPAEPRPSSDLQPSELLPPKRDAPPPTRFDDENELFRDRSDEQPRVEAEPFEQEPYAPIDPRRSDGDVLPCDEIHNDRNCCTEQRDCRSAWELLKNNPLSANSVDITPSFAPDAEDAEILRQRRDNKLAESPSRTWHDRDGNVLAEGRFVDYRNRRVIVESDDGQRHELFIFDINTDDYCFITAWWNIPAECPLGTEQVQPRSWAPTTFVWTATAACHKPLYFEYETLERYGHSNGPLFDPLLAGAHFFGSVLILPYQMGMYPPGECMYELGYYRQGSCAPRLLQAFPLSVRGGLFQASVATGLPFIIP